jgi:recombination DNA repair RAD52 pathway protein
MINSYAQSEENSSPRKVMSSRQTKKGELPQYLTDAQLDFITQKTPQQYIKTRPGPGGMQVSYVEVGYVINVLNQAFGWNWDFKILDQQIGNTQVWVKGELTVRVKGQNITKSQFGGADIRKNKSGESISVADDLKTGSSDCLKKCASLLGIASDLYFKDLDSF